MAVLWLPACGDDDEPSVPTIAPPPEMTEYEKVIASRPPPRAMVRQRDDATGISVAFPKGWRVDRKPNVVLQAWASKDGPASGRYVENVTVTHFEAPDVTLDQYLATMRENTSAARPGLEEVVSGARKLGDREARLYRYTLPWKRGRIVEEATIVSQDGHICVIVGSCHIDDRPSFATTYTIIVQSLQWPRPDPNK